MMHQLESTSATSSPKKKSPPSLSSSRHSDRAVVVQLPLLPRETNAPEAARSLPRQVREVRHPGIPPQAWTPPPRPPWNCLSLPFLPSPSHGTSQGKTSLIKAMAQHTGRNVVSIPLARIETNQELMDIVFDQSFAVKVLSLTRPPPVTETSGRGHAGEALLQRHHLRDGRCGRRLAHRPRPVLLRQHQERDHQSDAGEKGSPGSDPHRGAQAHEGGLDCRWRCG
jgi:hypothetical protein